MNKHLLCAPHKVKGWVDAWWYEEPQGLCLVLEPQPNTAQVVIPWIRIRAALKRKDKKA